MIMMGLISQHPLAPPPIYSIYSNTTAVNGIQDEENNSNDRKAAVNQPIPLSLHPILSSAHLQSTQDREDKINRGPYSQNLVLLNPHQLFPTLATVVLVKLQAELLQRLPTPQLNFAQRNVPKRKNSMQLVDVYFLSRVSLRCLSLILIFPLLCIESVD